MDVPEISISVCTCGKEKVRRMARTRKEIKKLHAKKERRLREKRRHPPPAPEPLEIKAEPKRKPKAASRSKKE
jgi:hypothetical protein